jgi:hypothetical protein
MSPFHVFLAHHSSSVHATLSVQGCRFLLHSKFWRRTTSKSKPLPSIYKVLQTIPLSQKGTTTVHSIFTQSYAVLTMRGMFSVLNSVHEKQISGILEHKNFEQFAMAGTPDYSTPPKNFNYPGYQNYFQTKLTYMVPLYTGGKLSAYGDISEKMEEIKKLDADQMKTEKRYELRKSYYDMALLQNSIDHMKTIHKNISTLERTTKMMIQEGYAKKVDLLEVEARKANVERSLTEMEANKKLLYHYLSFSSTPLSRRSSSLPLIIPPQSSVKPMFWRTTPILKSTSWVRDS